MCRTEPTRPKTNGGSGEGSEGGWDNLDLVTLEAEIFELGRWDNFDDLESKITMDELEVLVKSVREKEWRLMKFQASLKGVDLEEDDDKKDEALEAIKQRAQARIDEMHRSKNEAADFAEIGIKVVRG